MESESTQWSQIYRRLKSGGKPCAPRGLQILEVENFSYSLAPYVRFPNFEARHLNLEYIREEFQWYLGGDPYDLGILEHASIWRNLVLRGRLNSNYGLYVFRKGGLDWANGELARDKDSRRACITILDDTHLKAETVDVPCTAYMNFRIRNDRLNMSVHMRSQDAIYGMTNDAPAFSFVHEMLYVTLRDTCYQASRWATTITPPTPSMYMRAISRCWTNFVRMMRSSRQLKSLGLGGRGKWNTFAPVAG